MRATTLKDIDEAVWRMAKAMAVVQGVTIGKYIESLIREKLGVVKATDKRIDNGPTS